MQTMAYAAPGNGGQVALREMGLHLLFGLGTALAAGFLLSLLWGHLGLPSGPQALGLGQDARDQGLGSFISLAVPTAVFAPSLALSLLIFLIQPLPQKEQIARRALRLDSTTYLCLPMFLLLPLLWRSLGNGFTALGILFLGLITLKAAILLWLLWAGFLAPGAHTAGSERWRRQGAVLVTAAVIFAITAPWICQAVSTASDEVTYLVITHSLTNYGTISPEPTVASQGYREFYWGRWAPEMAVPLHNIRSWLFPFFLGPAYLLAGRLGVLLLFALVAGVLASQLLAWLEDVGISPGPAGLATLFVLSAAPIFFLSQQIFPDLLVMLLFVLSLRLLLQMGRRPLWALAGVLALAVLMTGIKIRFLPLAAGLVLTTGVEWTRRRSIWALVSAVGLGCLGLLFWLLWFDGGTLTRAWNLALTQSGRANHFWEPISIFLGGMLMDQSYGIILTAPVLLMALAGIPAALKRFPRPCLHILIPGLIYLAVICFARWFQWYGGFSGPGRFVAVLLPPLALPLALSMQALNRPWLRLLLWAPAALSLAYIWLATLGPAARYSRAIGVNPLLEKVQNFLDLDLHHLFPSAFTLSQFTLPWLVGLTGFVLLGAVLVWNHHRAKEPQDGGHHASRAASPPTLEEMLVLALICSLLMLAPVLAGKLYPARYLEAEQMRLSGPAARWAEYSYPQMMRGAVMLNGSRLSGRIHLPGPKARLSIEGLPSSGGRLLVEAGGASRKTNWSPGVSAIAVELDNVTPGRQGLVLTWSSCAQRRCNLLVDRIRVQ